MKLATVVEASCLLAGAALGALLLNFCAGRLASFKSEQAGFSVNSTAKRGFFEDKQVSCGAVEMEKVVRSLGVFKAAGNRTALWLGASQLYTIVECKPDDMEAVCHANALASAGRENIRYVQMADANANFNELLAAYLLALNAGARPDMLVLGMVYDDLKEPGVRPEIVAALKKLPPNFLRENAGDIFKDVLAEEAAEKGEAEAAKKADPVKRTALDGTPQEKLEAFFTDRLDAEWDAYRERPRLRAYIETKTTILMAQLAFSFRPRPPVRVPPELESWNMAAYRRLVELARKNGTEVFVYKAPHRPGQKPFFHVRSEYDGFFKKFAEECGRDGVGYADFETIVPEPLWQGRTQLMFPDVFHFSGGAHKILGGKVFDATRAGTGGYADGKVRRNAL